MWLAAVAGTLMLWLPGGALRRALRIDRVPDPIVDLALQLAVGMSFWPVLLLWSTTAGMRWTPWKVRIVVAALLVIAAKTYRVRRAPLAWAPLLIPFCLLMLETAVSRALQARGLAFPPWVDSVHHAAIARAMLAAGAVPATLAPILPDAPLSYHWGYHALLAFTAWVTGQVSPLDLPALMIGFGQLVNMLTFVSVYAGARILFRD